ncbi:MAG: class I SAM-dependent methyltransferase [Streptosporangiaceae bacterium]
MISEISCRACRATAGRVVLDLGEQPACDYFPQADDPGPDPVHPLAMWLCSSCGLAQLVSDPTVRAEPRGAEPAALVAQAADAVDQIAAAGLLAGRCTIAEYGSPHGGSWLGQLAGRGLAVAGAGAPADVVLDCFGLMHASDQASALARRASRVAPGGVLLFQYHALDTIIRLGQWNALRHGHYAYYSATALTAMLATHGFSPRQAWQFELYGGTVLLAAQRDADSPGVPGAEVRALLARDTQVGVRDPAVFAGLQRSVPDRARALHAWLAVQQAAGRAVLGYGAASRAVTLLRSAGVDRALVPAVADASPGKQGLRMPGTDIPIIDPAQLAARRPDRMLLFLSDLMPEVRVAFPEVEAGGGRWVDAETLR